MGLSFNSFKQETHKRAFFLWRSFKTTPQKSTPRCNLTGGPWKCAFLFRESPKRYPKAPKLHTDLPQDQLVNVKISTWPKCILFATLFSGVFRNHRRYIPPPKRACPFTLTRVDWPFYLPKRKVHRGSEKDLCGHEL